MTNSFLVIEDKQTRGILHATGAVHAAEHLHIQQPFLRSLLRSPSLSHCRSSRKGEADWGNPRFPNREKEKLRRLPRAWDDKTSVVTRRNKCRPHFLRHFSLSWAGPGETRRLSVGTAENFFFLFFSSCFYDKCPGIFPRRAPVSGNVEQVNHTGAGVAPRCLFYWL